MFPYLHPTTIVILDDDPLFLESFQFRFSDEVLLKTFSDPATLVKSLIDGVGHLPSPDRFLVPHEADGASQGGRILRVDGSAIASLMRSAKRFAQVSVAIIDYDMPTMSGLQVCRALSNLPVRKILLTGKAGMETGVTALNEGLIDCYVAKQDRNLTKTLRALIARQRDAYFTHLTRSLGIALGDDEMGFRAVPAFEDVLEQLYARTGAVEHYVTTDPPGVVVLSADGQPEWLVAAKRTDLISQAQVARDGGAPTELVALLEDCRVIPVFPGGFYDAALLDWRRHLVPARRLAPDVTWYCGTATALPALHKHVEGAVSLDAHLNSERT